MKKLLAYFFLALATATYARAQSTTVSSTGVVDSDSLTWSNAKVTINFVPATNFPSFNSYTWTGGTLQPSYITTTNGSGAFSQNIPTTANISPVGSSWVLQICPNATSGCFNYPFISSGASQNITAALNAVLPGPRFSVFSNGFGYGTIETNNTIAPGTIFFNTSSNTCNIYAGINAGGWSTCATGSGMVYPAAGIGNSTGSSWGASYNASNQIPANYVNLSTYLTAAVAASTYAPIFSLTTTGSSGPATYSGNVLNIPQYSGSGGYTSLVQNADGSLTASKTIGGPTCPNTNVSGSATVNLDTANCQTVTATGSVTLSFTNTNTMSAGWDINFCNNSSATLASWTLGASLLEIGLPTLSSHCVMNHISYDGTNYHGLGGDEAGLSRQSLVSAPASPPAGYSVQWNDSTDLDAEMKNSAGTIFKMVKTGVDINPLTGNVIGLDGIPFCTGISPTNGQFYSYTTGSSPNPCVTATTGSSSGVSSIIGPSSSMTGAVTITGSAVSQSGNTLTINTGSYNPNICAAVGNASSLTDIINNNTGVSGNQFFSDVCSFSASSANTIDGTHHGVYIPLLFDFQSNAVPSWTWVVGTCPTANWSGNTCSSGFSALLTFSAVTPATTSGAPNGTEFQFDIQATGTNGTFVATLAARPPGAFTNMTPPTSTNTIACGTNCTGGAWTLVIGASFSADAGGTGTCNGVSTGGTNCASLKAISWLGN